MVKISDVAKAAGVSVATVSRALNDHPTVNPDYAERVREAAQRLGYRPNGIARSLRTRSTDVIALIISDVSNPFFTAITRGVEDVAQKAGYSVLLCNADEDSKKEATYIDVALQQQVAGVILSPHHASTDVSTLEDAHIPVVVIDRPLRRELDSVMVNSLEGARVATEHLIEQGWKRPACITGPRDATTAEQRLQGYRETVKAHGMSEVFTHAIFRERGGERAAAKLLDMADPPDALFVANARMALGVLDEIGRRDLQIGRDIGIITFDDAPWARFVSPAMSVVAQPDYEIGARAAEILVSRLTHKAAPELQHETLSTTLVARESSYRTT